MYQSCKSSNLHVPKLFYGSVWLQNSFCFQPNHYIFSEGNFSVLSSCISIQDCTQNIMQTTTLDAYDPLVLVHCRELDGH